MEKVMVFGSFDYVHAGHSYFLKEAKKYGSLVVVIARDVTIKKVKGRMPRFGEEERKKAIKDLGIADKVILGSEGDKYNVIEDEKPNIICLGYDQKAFVDNLSEELKKRDVSAKIVRIGAYHPEKYKSSLLKRVQENSEDN